MSISNRSVRRTLLACVFSAAVGGGLVIGLYGPPERFVPAADQQTPSFTPTVPVIPPAGRSAQAAKSPGDPLQRSTPAGRAARPAPAPAVGAATPAPASSEPPVGRLLPTNPQPAGPPPASPRPSSPQPAGGAQPVPSVWPHGRLTPEERINVAVYENVNRSVVHINTRTMQVDRLMLFEIPSKGEGSGMVLDRQGHILTNFHVIEDAREIQVSLYNGKTYEAELVGVDPPTDTAVLKIAAPADSLYPVTFGNSAELLVGQRVFAIGNPFGLERTLSTGIISSLHRTLPERHTGRRIKDIIQIDASINPGSSGGPLLDSRGLMIGMNTAIASKIGESAGVGFAIPVNTIARVVSELMRNGRVIRPDSGIARVYQTEQGLLIASLTPGGPAEQAGLRGPKVVRQRKREGPVVYERQYIDRSAADLIVAVDGQPVKTADEFLTLIESKSPGDQVVVTVMREGERVDVPLELGVSD